MSGAVFEAVRLASNLFEANHIAVTNDIIEDQVQSWYDNSDIADPEMLAAAVLEWGYWRMIPYAAWCDAKDKWFCEIPIEYQGYPSIEEIESAQHDMMFMEA